MLDTATAQATVANLRAVLGSEVDVTTVTEAQWARAERVARRQAAEGTDRYRVTGLTNSRLPWNQF